MTHLNEEQLILAYYQELRSAEADQHLSGCDHCRQELEGLRHDLAILDAMEIPERPADYDQQLWNRLRWKMGRRQPSRRWIPLTAAASLLMVAVLATQWLNRDKDQLESVTQNRIPSGLHSTVSTPAVSTEDRVLLLVVSEHFDRSSRLLLEVSNVPTSGPANLEPEQKSAEELIEANRLYRQTASRSGQRDLVAVLEELEPILLSLAHAPPHIQAVELRALQKRIESKGMVFKLRMLADSDSPIPGGDRGSV